MERERLGPIEHLTGAGALAVTGLKAAFNQLKGGRWAEFADIVKPPLNNVIEVDFSQPEVPPEAAA